MKSNDTRPAYRLHPQSRLVCFKLDEELRKMCRRLVASAEQREILSPHEESNLRPSDLCSEVKSYHIYYFYQCQKIFGKSYGLLKSIS